MRYLLDTSALLAHWRQELGWEEIQRLLQGDDEFLIACISLAELGRRMRELGASPDEVLRTLDDYQVLLVEVVPIDAEIARAALEIAWRTDRRLPLVDALIAAAAQARDATLVHRDAHMSAIPPTVVRARDLAAPDDADQPER